MAGYQTAPQEREDNTLPSPETFSTRQNKSHHWPEDHSALFSGRILDRADSKVYAIVGVCFLLAAILALVYTFWAFGVSLIELPKFSMDQQPGHIAQAIIEIVSGLLLVLIIMEMQCSFPGKYSSELHL